MMKPSKKFNNIFHDLIGDIKAIAEDHYQQAYGKLEQDWVGGHTLIQYSIHQLVDEIPQEQPLGMRRLLLKGKRNEK